MHITAVHELRHQPWDIALLRSGELVTLSWSRQGMHLDAYDAELANVWSRNAGQHALGLTLDPTEIPWIVDRAGASTVGKQGEIDSRVEAPAIDGMEVAALTFVDDDLVFAYQHRLDAPPARPVLVRQGRNGAVRWSSTLTLDAVTFEHASVERGASEGGRHHPSDWVCGYLRAGELAVSGDTVLAVYADMPRTGMGIGYAVSLTDGTLAYHTARGPIDRVAPRGAGAFLVGYQGYGEFETVLYAGDGTTEKRWRSQGFFVVEGSDTRVIETENTSLSRSRLARLMPDGTVMRGDLLEGYHTSHPHLHGDGTLYFAREGLLIAARDLAVEDRIVISPEFPAQGVFHTRVLASAEGLFCTWAAYRLTTGSHSGPPECLSGLVHIAI